MHWVSNFLEMNGLPSWTLGVRCDPPSPRDSWDGLSREPLRSRGAEAVGMESGMNEYDYNIESPVRLFPLNRFMF